MSAFFLLFWKKIFKAVAILHDTVRQKFHPILRSYLFQLAKNEVQPDIDQQLDWVTVDWHLIAQISIHVKHNDRWLSSPTYFSAPLDSN